MYQICGKLIDYLNAFVILNFVPNICGTQLIILFIFLIHTLSQPPFQ